MPGTTITGSSNLTLFDSRIIADVCNAQFIVDASPSVFIGTGASNVLGVKVKIVNPYGVVIKDYTGSYDIAPPLTGNYTRSIPTQASKVQFGNYTITLELTDADNSKYYVEKIVNVCTYNEATNPCDDRLRLVANCNDGRLIISLAEPPVFKGFFALSRNQTLHVYFPTESAVAPLTSFNGSFAVQLFEGVYKVSVSVCATYDITDNVFLKLGYAGVFEKNVKCNLDYTCIWPRIKQLNDKLKEDCSQADRDQNASVVLDALRLLRSAELANQAGEDASDYINELEVLLGCKCTCECTGMPVSGVTPATNIIVEGCSVSQNTVGLTTIYTIDASEFVLEVDPLQDIITASAPSITTCTSMQRLYFNVAKAYAAIKNQINNSTEYNFWAGIIRNALSGLDTSCLTAPTSTLLQLVQSLINKACQGGSCNAILNNVQVAEGGNQGDNVTMSGVLITWDNVSGVFGVDIWVDGVFRGAVLSDVEEFFVPGVADAEEHIYKLIPYCANGSQGETVSGSFLKVGCPQISPPVVSQNVVDDVDCPYDLTALVSPPPIGIETEWHTANNTWPSSLVPDPTNVSSGIYYAFAKNAFGCYSTSTSVSLICSGATSCTAPQSLVVSQLGPCFHFIQFQSAAFPPPGNSYSIKRKLAADPDVDGSYTTIGTSAFNIALNLWVLCDSTALDNVLYTYKAISNCGGSPGTLPYTQFTYANIDCPALNLTPSQEYIDYSFTNSGGGIDKYEVSIYDSTGTILIHKDTILPAFSSPITGQFIYLDPSTTYRVQIKAFIGTYSKTCSQVVTATLAP